MRMTVTQSSRLRTSRAGRASNVRRQRGYSWEGTLVRRFNALDGWSAYRLGSPSVSLPDVLALNPERGAAFVIEAKSGTTDRLAVPADQIERCVEWAGALAPFSERRIVLAFKFLSKRRVGRGVYVRRPLREYYKEWDARARRIECVCLYDGTTYGRDGRTRTRLELADGQIPISAAKKPTRRSGSQTGTNLELPGLAGPNTR